eukprot:1152524-Pelagomonas_calceolata.AAC.2
MRKAGVSLEECPLWTHPSHDHGQPYYRSPLPLSWATILRRPMNIHHNLKYISVVLVVMVSVQADSAVPAAWLTAWLPPCKQQAGP